MTEPSITSPHIQYFQQFGRFFKSLPSTDMLRRAFSKPAHTYLHTDLSGLSDRYGCNDLPRKAARAIYDYTGREMCEGIGIKHFTAAYSYPKNVKDLVTKAKLHMAAGKEASKYCLGELSAKRKQ